MINKDKSEEAIDVTSMASSLLYECYNSSKSSHQSPLIIPITKISIHQRLRLELKTDGHHHVATGIIQQGGIWC